MNAFENGYWNVGRIAKVPIRVHWTIPLGMLLFTRGSFVPGAWVGIFLIIFFHELGHAAMVKRAGAKVEAVEMMALGGLCRWSGHATAIDRAIIAWWGVWAQMVMLAVTLILGAIFGPPTIAFVSQLEWVMIETNLFIMGLNLLPVRPLDGAEAWVLFRLLWQRWKGRRQVKRDFGPAPKRRSHLRAVPTPSDSDPRRDEIVERMLKEATQNPQPIDRDEDN